MYSNGREPFAGLDRHGTLYAPLTLPKNPDIVPDSVLRTTSRKTGKPCPGMANSHISRNLHIQTTSKPDSDMLPVHLETQTKEQGLMSILFWNRPSKSNKSKCCSITKHRGNDNQECRKKPSIVPETIIRSNSLASDGSHSSRSITSGSTLVSSMIHGSADTTQTTHSSHARVVDIDAASIETDLGCIQPRVQLAQPTSSSHYAQTASNNSHGPSFFTRCFRPRRKPNPPVLVFVLRPHMQYRGVLEVIDCEDMSVAYRKLARDTHKIWCETFHEVVDQPSVSRNVGPSGTTSFACHRDADGIADPSSVDTYLCGRPKAPCSTSLMPFSDVNGSSGSNSSSSSSSTRCSNDSSSQYGSAGWPNQCTSRKGACGCNASQTPPSFSLCQLWEISSPNPVVFPMHCRDARGLIDPVPLTTMVLDRHQFCFRFILCGNRMRWQVTSKDCSQRIELQCFVRSTMVAMLFCTADNLEDKRPMHDALGNVIRGETDRMSVWNNRRCTSSLQLSTSDSRGSKLPSIVILPMAFGKMPEVDTAVVESFVLFTGIEVLERFICSENALF